nr:Glutaminase A [Rachicladosporium sp. CCFEE 5018]
MVIMALAYAQKTGDTGYLSQHYALLKQWTGFLVDMALIPANQISTDDFAGALANQTDLALKGIIGIQAMSIISIMTGNAADGANFSSIATSYIAQWQSLGIAQDANPRHTTLSYGQNDTHGLLYNLYADALVQTHLVPRSVYEMQSNFYPTVANEYGVPLDTRHVYSKNDWEMWCAAISNTDTRNMFIGTLAKWIGATSTGGPVTDLFDTITGGYAQQAGLPAFQARPVVGGWFSLLALNSTGIPA